jgi:ribosomal protein L10
MKVGDLVRYVTGTTAIVLYINDVGGTVKVVNDNGNIAWLVTSDCEVISAHR